VFPVRYSISMLRTIEAGRRGSRELSGGFGQGLFVRWSFIPDS